MDKYIHIIRRIRAKMQQSHFLITVLLNPNMHKIRKKPNTYSDHPQECKWVRYSTQSTAQNMVEKRIRTSLNCSKSYQNQYETSKIFRGCAPDPLLAGGPPPQTPHYICGIICTPKFYRPGTIIFTNTPLDIRILKWCDLGKENKLLLYT